MSEPSLYVIRSKNQDRLAIIEPGDHVTLLAIKTASGWQPLKRPVKVIGIPGEIVGTVHEGMAIMKLFELGTSLDELPQTRR